MNRDATRPAVPARPRPWTSDPGRRIPDPARWAPEPERRVPEPGRRAPDQGPAPDQGRPAAQRPTLEELRLTAFKSYRRATLPLAP